MPQTDPDDGVKSEVIELQVIPYASGRTGGRPLFLNARRFIHIVKLIERGATTTRACQIMLVSYSNFRRHIARNPKYARRLRAAELCRDQIWKSEAMDAVRAAFGKNWISAMTFLERRWPNEYALRKVDRTDASEDKPTEEIPSERLAHHRALMLQLAREDERAAAEQPILPDTPVEGDG